MDFIDQLRSLSVKIETQAENVQTEEATKNAFIMPFIHALGYDVFNPMEVVPEFIADVGKKKGEKVDYAIITEDKPTILFECKSCNTNLDDCHAAQLRRYFHVTDARIGILTNGTMYKFYSDLEANNIMDEKPFMEIDILNIDELLIPELKKLSKNSFELDNILSTANNLKYTRELKNEIEAQLNSPSPDFVRLIIANIHSGVKTQQVIEHFTPLVKKSFSLLVSENINSRLKTALSDQDTQDTQITEDTAHIDEELVDNKGIITTEEELEGFMIIKAIMREVVDVTRLVHRDTKSYFGILLDDNNRKPICRLHFNAGQKYIGVIDIEKNETRHPIETLDDIYKFSDLIKAAINIYE